MFDFDAFQTKRKNISLITPFNIFPSFAVILIVATENQNTSGKY